MLGNPESASEPNTPCYFELSFDDQKSVMTNRINNAEVDTSDPAAADQLLELALCDRESCSLDPAAFVDYSLSRDLEPGERQAHERTLHLKLPSDCVLLRSDTPE